MNALPRSPEEMPLPSLREDIRLLPARSDAYGASQWTVFDPLAHAYFQIDLEAFQLLSCWFGTRTVGELMQRVEARHGRKPLVGEIEAVIRFVGMHRLIAEATGGWRGLAETQARQKESPWRSLLHNYLFFKLPLVRPDSFLKATLPMARLLVSWPVLLLISVLSLTGLFLVSRRWGVFIGTFNDFWTPAGATFFAAVLLVLKLFHELGHAYVATAKGCHVQSMGIAVMLGTPMPYTDVTDSWKLTKRSDRMAIDLAGVSVELAIAGLATLAWVFLPDGPLRAVAFVFATTGWVMSLGVNLNPFMRFDGYFVLADLLKVPNLQPRSFALAKWFLRRMLFGVKDAPPDTLDGSLRNIVIAYGFAVWIYRLVVFTGIALAVYTLFFKILGIFLFLIEIMVFIVLPIYRELKHWWSERRRFAATLRTLLTGSVAAGLLALGIIPWSSSVNIPGALEPQEFARVFPKAAGEIKAIHIHVGDVVAAGAVLAEIDQPRIRKDLRLVEAKLGLLRDRLNRRVVDRKDLAITPQLEQEREALLIKQETLKRELENLIIRSPVAGVVREVNPLLHPGRSIARDEELAIIVANTALVVRGYVGQHDIWRLKTGGTGVFVPEGIEASALPVILRDISPVGAQSIEIPILASVHGGKVETWPQGKAGELAPVNASHLTHFDITASISKPAPAVQPLQVQRGMVRLEALPESFAARALRHILNVLVQESGI